MSIAHFIDYHIYHLSSHFLTDCLTHDSHLRRLYNESSYKKLILLKNIINISLLEDIQAAGFILNTIDDETSKHCAYYVYIPALFLYFNISVFVIQFSFMISPQF